METGLCNQLRLPTFILYINNFKIHLVNSSPFNLCMKCAHLIFSILLLDILNISKSPRCCLVFDIYTPQVVIITLLLTLRVFLAMAKILNHQ